MARAALEAVNGLNLYGAKVKKLFCIFLSYHKPNSLNIIIGGYDTITFVSVNYNENLVLIFCLIFLTIRAPLGP